MQTLRIDKIKTIVEIPITPTAPATQMEIKTQPETTATQIAIKTMQMPETGENEAHKDKQTLPHQRFRPAHLIQWTSCGKCARNDANHSFKTCSNVNALLRQYPNQRNYTLHPQVFHQSPLQNQGGSNNNQRGASNPQAPTPAPS